MRLLLISTLMVLLSACASTGQDRAQKVFSMQEDAERYYQQGDFSKAMQGYQQLVAELPGNTQGWLRLGNCHAQLGNYNQAVSAYQEALKLDPKFSNAWINLTYVQAQQLSQTVAAMYEQVPRSDPQAQRVQQLVDAVLKPFPVPDADTAVGQQRSGATQSQSTQRQAAREPAVSTMPMSGSVVPEAVPGAEAAVQSDGVAESAASDTRSSNISSGEASEVGSVEGELTPEPGAIASENAQEGYEQDEYEQEEYEQESYEQEEASGEDE